MWCRWSGGFGLKILKVLEKILILIPPRYNLEIFGRFWPIFPKSTLDCTILSEVGWGSARFSEVPVFWNFVHELYNNIISLILSESANIMAQKSKIKVKIILKMGSSGHPESNKLIPKFWSPRLTPIWAFKSDQKLQRTSFIVK